MSEAHPRLTLTVLYRAIRHGSPRDPNLNPFAPLSISTLRTGCPEPFLQIVGVRMRRDQDERGKSVAGKMKVTVLTGPQGSGKSTVMRAEAIAQPGLYIFASPTHDLIDEQVAASSQSCCCTTASRSRSWSSTV